MLYVLLGSYNVARSRHDNKQNKSILFESKWKNGEPVEISFYRKCKTTRRQRSVNTVKARCTYSYNSVYAVDAPLESHKKSTYNRKLELRRSAVERHGAP